MAVAEEGLTPPVPEDCQHDDIVTELTADTGFARGTKKCARCNVAIIAIDQDRLNQLYAIEAAGQRVSETLGVMDRPGTWQHGQECVDALEQLRVALAGA